MDLFQITVGEGPLVAAAIHDGHYLRPEVADVIAISDSDRLREEDPFTSDLIDWAPTRLVGRRSRYEVDLNRPRDQAVYVTPEQAWGLNVWREPLAPDVVARSLASYDQFYASAESTLRSLVRRYGQVVVLDVHSYNHRRNGADRPAADDAENPEVNIGTGSLDRSRWGSLVEGFMTELGKFGRASGPLDVRENVKFQGGHFCRWIHHTFPSSVCGLAIEFKKTFMDEWTGEVDRSRLAELRQALRATAPVLLHMLRQSPP